MGFFGILFWIAVLYLVIRACRRSGRCVAVGPSDDAPERARQEYMDSLESRLVELEERLDFTERLLAGKRVSG